MKPAPSAARFFLVWRSDCTGVLPIRLRSRAGARSASQARAKSATRSASASKCGVTKCVRLKQAPPALSHLSRCNYAMAAGFSGPCCSWYARQAPRENTQDGGQTRRRVTLAVNQTVCGEKNKHPWFSRTKQLRKQLLAPTWEEYSALGIHSENNLRASSAIRPASMLQHRKTRWQPLPCAPS